MEGEGEGDVLIDRLMGSISKHDKHAGESVASARQLPALIV